MIQCRFDTCQKIHCLMRFKERCRDSFLCSDCSIRPAPICVLYCICCQDISRNTRSTTTDVWFSKALFGGCFPAHWPCLMLLCTFIELPVLLCQRDPVLTVSSEISNARLNSLHRINCVDDLLHSVGGCVCKTSLRSGSYCLHLPGTILQADPAGGCSASC